MKIGIISTLFLSLVLFTVSELQTDAHNLNRVGLQGYPPFVVGLEGEFSLPDYPVGFSANYTVLNGGVSWVTALGRVTLASSENFSFGFHAGLNQTWIYLENSATPFGNLVHDNIGNNVRGANAPLVIGGLFYERTWDKLRMRLSPSLSYFAPGAGVSRGWNVFRPSEVGLVGPAWVELGYEVTPSFELSLRSNIAPLSATFKF